MGTTGTFGSLRSAVDDRDREIERLRLELSQMCPKFDFSNVSDMASVKQYVMCQFTAVVFAFIGFVFGRVFDSMICQAIAKKFDIKTTIAHDFLSPTLIICSQIILAVIRDSILTKSHKSQDKKLQKQTELISEQVMIRLKEFSHEQPLTKVVAVPPTPSPNTSQRKIVLPEKYVLPEKFLLRMPDTHADLTKPLKRLNVAVNVPPIQPHSPSIIVHAPSNQPNLSSNPFVSDPKKLLNLDSRELDAIDVV